MSDIFDFDADLDAILAEFSDQKKDQAEEKLAHSEVVYSQPIFQTKPNSIFDETHPVNEPNDTKYQDDTGNDDEEKFIELNSNNRAPTIERAPFLYEVEEKELQEEKKKTEKSKRTKIITQERKEPRRPKDNGAYVAQKGTSTAKRVFRGTLGTIFAGVSFIVLIWVALNVHPDSGTSTFSKANSKTDLVSKIDLYVNNSKSDLLGDVTYIQKRYKIPENDLTAPAPNQAFFVSVPNTEASKVMDVIADAEQVGLLEGQKVIFSPDVEFYSDSPINYYYDESILVICWKELIEGRVTSCVEVKICDGSQFRRKLCEDTYGSSVQDYCSNMAKSVNAVVAMNADFYLFRDLGITVYQRQLYRFNEYTYTGFYQAFNSTDTCFVTSSGEMLYMRRGEQNSRETVEEYIRKNDVLFSLAFGPVLVDNYEVQPLDSYPVGEVNLEYSRAGLGQVDSLHYLYMTVSHSLDNTPRCTVPQFAEMFGAKGVKSAYCLDGGQTGEVVFNGEPYNYIDYGAERTVSDIIYFASAVPEG